MIKYAGKTKKGYTLMEVIIAVCIFSIVGMIALNIFINIVRIQGRLTLENNIYEDSRFMMERLARSIRDNTIDYEEYFNKAISSTHQYGEFYGCYAAQFYNPGLGKTGDLTANPGDLGALCNDGKSYIGQDCVVFKPSMDLNTGQYPYRGAPGGAAASNAFCPAYKFGVACTPASAKTVSELYLINREGTIKTIFASKLVNATTNQHALAMVSKEGEDTNKDGVTEKWLKCGTGGANAFCCPTTSSNYDCTGIPSLEDSLTDGQMYKGFIPMSPLRTNVTRLTFRISPGDDPRKAFAEPGSISQPKVIITLEAQPSDDQLGVFGGLSGDEIPKIVLQTTVSVRTQGEVKSYLGPDTYNIVDSGGLTCKLSAS